MSDQSNAPEKAVNYTPEQEAYLTENAPISYEMACDLAAEWGKKPRSVIAKVLQLGLEYVPKPKPQKKVSKGDTKAQLVSKIEAELDSADYFGGLEKATSSALVNLLGVIRVYKKTARE